MLSRKSLIIVILLIVPSLVLLFFYKVFQPTKSLVNIKADYIISANELFHDFEENESKANAKYVGKVLEVKGKIKEINTSSDHTSIILETNEVFGGINCSLATEKFELKGAAPGANAVIKGECSGKLMDVMLNNCFIVSIEN